MLTRSGSHAHTEVMRTLPPPEPIVAPFSALRSRPQKPANLAFRASNLWTPAAPRRGEVGLSCEVFSEALNFYSRVRFFRSVEF
jgi:hypothetical protein